MVILQQDPLGAETPWYCWPQNLTSLGVRELCFPLDVSVWSSRGSTAIWEMRKIISLHIFWVVFPQWLPFSAFSLKGYPKRKIPQISIPSGSHHLMSNLPKSGPCCTELGWRSLFVSPSRSSSTLTRNLRVMKSTFILICPTRKSF